jgi:hypothetical protein
MAEGVKRNRIWPATTIVLLIGLVIMIVLYVQILTFINRLVTMAVDLIEKEVLTEAPEGVDRERVKSTFGRMKQSIPRGKVNFGKARAAATYAQKARSDDDGWTSEEVNTLVEMMNAAMGPEEKK